MATLAYIWTNTRFIFIVLVLSVMTALALQTFSPALILVVYILAYVVILFYYYPMVLIALWLVLYYVSTVLPDMINQVGSLFLVPMDPAYFFSVVFLIIYSLVRPKEFLSAVKADPFLSIFILLILLYIYNYTPIYGKQAIGEARKTYFVLFFPALVYLSAKKPEHIRQLFLGTFFLALAFLMTSLTRLLMGASGRELANAQMALVFLLTIWSILIFHINGRVILSRSIDITVLGLCLTFVILPQHRSVFIACAFGLLLICVLYLNRVVVVLKMVFRLAVFFTLMGIILMSNSQFQQRIGKALNGIVNPSSDLTASWRMRGWSRQFDTFSTSDLLFGQGLGGYYRAFNEAINPVSARGRIMPVEPHNGYIQIIANFGVLGLLIYELLAFRFYWKIFAVRRTAPRGLLRAYMEIGFLNFTAGQAFMVGYGFCFPILAYLGMGMAAIKLIDYSAQIGEQAEQWKVLEGQGG